MIKVELTKDTEDFPAGVVLSVDENSAAALIERGDAKLVEDAAPTPAVQSGGDRARAMNKQAEADRAKKSTTTPESETPQEAQNGRDEG